MPIIRGKEKSFPTTDQPQGGWALRGLGVRFQGAGARGWRLPGVTGLGYAALCYR